MISIERALFKADPHEILRLPFLRGLRLSELPSLGREPKVSLRALGAAPEGCERGIEAFHARFSEIEYNGHCLDQ